MNTGIQDAHNLAWKIAAVETGWASPALLDTYELERRPVAQSNTDQSLANALKMFEVFAALGLSEDLDASRRNFRRSLATPAARAGIATAIANQQDHFDMFGLQLGFRYEAGALVLDGRESPRRENPVRDFVPCLRSGARLPHAWVTRNGRCVSILDLVADGELTLITDAGGEAWVQAARAAAPGHVRTWIEGRDFSDRDGHWEAVREIGRGGAILVRPDQHVAWYACAPRSDATTQLSSAVAAVACR